MAAIGDRQEETSNSSDFALQRGCSGSGQLCLVCFVVAQDVQDSVITSRQRTFIH